MHGFGKFAEVIGEDVDDLHPASQALARRGDDLFAVAHLFRRRQQREPVAEGPAVELHVREFEPRDAGAFRVAYHVFDRVVIQTVQHAVQRQRDLSPEHALQRLDLPVVDGRAGDAIGEFALRRLDADLNVIEPAATKRSSNASSRKVPCVIRLL